MSALIALELVAVNCCNAACGVTFGLSKHHYEALSRSHGNFHCPNGHSQRFMAKTREEELKEALDKARVARDRAEQGLYDAQRAADAAKAKLAKTAKRIHAGVCPLCNRTFKVLARHMASKHAAEGVAS